MITIIFIIKGNRLHYSKWIDGFGGGGSITPLKRGDIDELPTKMDN